MIRSLSSAVSGLQNFQERLDVTSNNIANVNTVAFKSARTNLSDSFSQTLGGATVSQIGLGVQTSAITNQYIQGATSGTGVLTDLAVAGEGFFVVRDTINNDEFVTRAGDFRIDANNFLVTSAGMRIQGFNDSALSTRGDLQIDSLQAPVTADPTATLAAFNIDLEGKIHVRLTDGTEYIRGQVLLQRFSDPNALVKEGNNLYSGIGAAGPLGGTNSPQAEPPGSNGLGKIQSGALELSNVDLSNEFSTLIQTQRAFQANARMVTTSDEILQELINLKR